ncbi:MAG: heavy-metal-associated domain-containing protein [bacterium]|jgi:mercuric ion binding protein
MRLYITFFVLLFAFSATAQQKKPVTVKINTPTIQCEMCKKRIEDYLKYEEGILKSTVDVKYKRTTVVYLADRTNVENIKTAIANTGYDADDVKASDEAYKELPKCCKKPAQ